MQLSASAWAKLGRAGVGVSPELKCPTNVLSVEQITETLSNSRENPFYFAKLGNLCTRLLPFKQRKVRFQCLLPVTDAHGMRCHITMFSLWPHRYKHF